MDFKSKRTKFKISTTGQKEINQVSATKKTNR